MCRSQEFSATESYAIVTHSTILIPDCKIFRKNCNPNNPKWWCKMEYELEEVERDYIEFRKEMGEE
ncbi:hypothetical protein MSSIT_2730 [Methanosarcina siciliae T4/M]|uniref:Uncharacterized protein n=2 Tax=Methanosarcina siciliae TaxID=38027 RepID=A0A0E3P6N2_9EURY|nr:hypothetical protein MSSIT_2730 [Methanosarcina siciliae T4/M]